MRLSVGVDVGNRNTLITVLMVVFGAIGFVSIVHDVTEPDYRDGVRAGIERCNSEFKVGYGIGRGFTKPNPGTFFTPCTTRGYEEGTQAKADADKIADLTERNNDLREDNDKLEGRVDKLEERLDRNGPTIIVVTPAERPTEKANGERPAYCDTMTAADAGWLSQTGRGWMVRACLVG